MRIGPLVASVASLSMIGACASGSSTFGSGAFGTRNDLTCRRSPCTVEIPVVAPIFSESCKIDFNKDLTVTIAPGVDVSWTLPFKFFSTLKFVGPVGIRIENPSPDFIDRGFGDGGEDRGTYVWSGNTTRDKQPRKYSFAVVWKKIGHDEISCGPIDPVIVNSLDPAFD